MLPMIALHARAGLRSVPRVSSAMASTQLQMKVGFRGLAASAAGAPNYKHLTVEKHGAEKRTALVRLNRPKALNALCDDLVHELNAALKALDADAEVGAIVLTGSERAFAAGADIKEMRSRGFVDSYMGNALGHWADITKIQTPIIAAVGGYALGGGCELAMMCDIIYAADTAKFGQPEIKLGTIPGCGGTQRLTRAVGKSKAMELILTGDNYTAQEALAAGLVARVFPAAELEAGALATARKIAAYSKPVVQIAKEAVNVAFESSLAEGVRFERRLFHATFSTKDRAEGMAAFEEKRKAAWKQE